MKNNGHYRCGAGHREFHPLCTCCFEEQQQEDIDTERNPDYFVIPPIKKDLDGMSRFILDTYVHRGTSLELLVQIEMTTGLQWTVLGAFMDTTCFGTKQDVLVEYKVPYPKKSQQRPDSNNYILP